MAIFTRRNALLGWSVIQTNRLRRLVKKARSGDRRRQGSLIALGAASLAGALAFVRSRRNDE